MSFIRKCGADGMTSMKDYNREYPLFSLCGLNCGLCPMHIGGYCPGCGGGEGHQSCGFIRCAVHRSGEPNGGVEYCHMCDEYPCERYAGVTEYDSFITHQNQLRNFERVKAMGIDAYRAELDERIGIVRQLLDGYNDGRRKNLFCLAANLLDIEDLCAVMEQLHAEDEPGQSLKEKAALAAGLLSTTAKRRDIVLKLNKKPRQK